MKRLILLLISAVLSLSFLHNVTAEDIITQKQVRRHEYILSRLTETGRQGTKGRLVLNDFTFSVALFESDERFGPDASLIVDAEDSAAWFMWFGSQSPIIADHCTQGFDIIKDCEPGDVCYIVDGDDYEEYKCVAVDHSGINASTNLYLSDGSDILRENDPGFLYMYTCNQPGNPRSITIAIWTPVEEPALPPFNFERKRPAGFRA